MAYRSYYFIELSHPGLHKHRVIRGNDKRLVEAAAATQQRAWAEQYARRVAVEERRGERENKRQELEDNVREANERTAEAQVAISELRGILAATLDVDDRVDWDGLMQPPFAQPQPFEKPYLLLPIEPTFDPDGWKKNRSFVTALLPFLAKRAESTARAEFDAIHAKWRERLRAAQDTNERIHAVNVCNFEDWQRRAAAYEESRAKHNESVASACKAYNSLNPDAILDYCELVLSRSQYPDCLPKEYELDYRAGTKTLVVRYQLPLPEDLPRTVSVKYSKAKGDFVEAELTKRESEQLFSDVVFQVAIRTLHELFEADAVGALEKVIFNGGISTVSSSTGNPEDRCLLSVSAERNAFAVINLRNVNPRACFESLGGIAGAKMADCRAVTPMGIIDQTGDRFTGAQDISEEGAEGLDEWRGLVGLIEDHQDIRFLPVGTIASLLGFPAQPKYSARLSRELAEAVAARGYAIEPDARYGASSYTGEEEIALFLPQTSPVTPAYPGAAALLQLCVMIAAADEHPTEDELEVARKFIRENASLTIQEHQRLQVLEQYLCRNPETAKRSLARIAKRLPPAQRQMVGEVLVCVAGADGVISSAEWGALDRACKVLELPQSALAEILRKLGANFDEQTVQEAAPPVPGEPIPGAAPEPVAPAFSLDMARVAAISHETAEVVGLLSAVMSEDELQPEPKQPALPRPAPALETYPWLNALDTKYHAMVARIVSRPSWPRGEFLLLSEEFKLLPLGVVDAINEWADEHLGDFLLEGDDPVIVNESILPKIP